MRQLKCENIAGLLNTFLQHCSCRKFLYHLYLDPVTLCWHWKYFYLATTQRCVIVIICSQSRVKMTSITMHCPHVTIMEHPSIIGDELASPILNYARSDHWHTKVIHTASESWRFSMIQVKLWGEKQQYRYKYLGMILTWTSIKDKKTPCYPDTIVPWFVRYKYSSVHWETSGGYKF